MLPDVTFFNNIKIKFLQAEILWAFVGWIYFIFSWLFQIPELHTCDVSSDIPRREDDEDLVSLR